MNHLETTQRAYSRGYNAARKRAWPDHIPITPPHEIVGPYVEAAHAIRDGLDALLATFDPEDECEKRLGPLIDTFDERSREITKWMDAKLSELAERESV